MSLTVIQRCNVCFKMKKDDKSFKLFFSNCGHLICDECRTSNSICPICNKKDITYIKIDDNLPDNLAIFFKDLAPMMKLHDKIIEFQNQQTAINQKQLLEQIYQLQNQIQIVLEQADKLEKDDQVKSNEIKHLKARLSEYGYQNKMLQQEKIQLEQVKSNEIKILKAKLADCELLMQKQNVELKTILDLNEKISIKKKIGKNIEDKLESKFEYKPEETKSTFFGLSQINQLKQVDENKRSPLNNYQESVKSSVSYQIQQKKQNYIIKSRQQNLDDDKNNYNNIDFKTDKPFTKKIPMTIKNLKYFLE